jgi:hypothetical protein
MRLRQPEIIEAVGKIRYPEDVHHVVQTALNVGGHHLEIVGRVMQHCILAAVPGDEVSNLIFQNNRHVRFIDKIAALADCLTATKDLFASKWINKQIRHHLATETTGINGQVIFLEGTVAETVFTMTHKVFRESGLFRLHVCAAHG